MGSFSKRCSAFLYISVIGKKLKHVLVVSFPHELQLFALHFENDPWPPNTQAHGETGAHVVFFSVEMCNSIKGVVSTWMGGWEHKHGLAEAMPMTSVAGSLFLDYLRTLNTWPGCWEFLITLIPLGFDPVCVIRIRSVLVESDKLLRQSIQSWPNRSQSVRDNKDCGNIWVTLFFSLDPRIRL